MVSDPSGLLQKLFDHQKRLNDATNQLRQALEAGANAHELAALETALREAGRQLDNEVIAPIRSNLERN